MSQNALSVESRRPQPTSTYDDAVGDSGVRSALNAREADLGARIAALETALGEVRRQAEKATTTDRVSLLVFSDELDRLLAAMSIANGAAASGSEVCMFFSFWSVAVLRKPDARPATLLDRVLGRLLPTCRTARLSRMHACGLGTRLMKRRMQRAHIDELETQLEMASELGVQIYVCNNSLTMLGLSPSDLIDFPNMATCGAASFLEKGTDSRMTLFA